VSSLDLVFSQAVLEHVDDPEETYKTMVAWLKPSGYASHVIDFSAHYLSIRLTGMDIGPILIGSGDWGEGVASFS
jgi:hypothetical protein